MFLTASIVLLIMGSMNLFTTFFKFDEKAILAIEAKTAPKKLADAYLKQKLVEKIGRFKIFIFSTPPFLLSGLLFLSLQYNYLPKTSYIYTGIVLFCSGLLLYGFLKLIQVTLKSEVPEEYYVLRNLKIGIRSYISFGIIFLTFGYN